MVRPVRPVARGLRSVRDERDRADPGDQRGGPGRLPILANCAADWVGPDADNVAAPGSQLYYLGTFWFEPGSNTLDMQHFCPSIRAGLCPELEDLSNPDSTCASSDGNSVGLVANGLCMVEPQPPQVTLR